MSDNILKHIYAATTVVFWSLAFALTRLVSGELGSISIGVIRCTVAAIVLLGIGKLMHIRLPFKKSHLILFAAEGLMGFSLYLLFFNTGLQTLTSATSSLIVALTPAFTAIGALFIFKERLKPFGWMCMGTAFAGVCILLLWDGDVSIGIGALWTLLAVLVFSGYNLLNRILTNLGYTAIEIVTYAMCFGALALMPFVPQTIREMGGTSVKSVLIVVFMGVTASAIAYFTWSQAFEKAKKLTEVTSYMYITPILASIAGALILGEMPNAGTYIGGAIIMASVIALGFDDVSNLKSNIKRG